MGQIIRRFAGFGASGCSTVATEPVFVNCQVEARDNTDIAVLLVECVRLGKNASRSTYAKSAQGAGGMDVYLYFAHGYGPVFRGRRFGNDVGWTQVWSYSANRSTFPPRVGWKVAGL